MDFVILLCFSLSIAQDVAKTQIVKTMTTLPPFGSHINPRYSSLVQYFQDGDKQSLFIFGGTTKKDATLSDAYIVNLYPLNIKRKHINSENKMPMVKNFAQFRINNTFFIWGGWKESGLSNSLWSYDTSTCTWKEEYEGETIPEARHSMAYASEGKKLYIYGGIGTSGLLNDVWEFNTETKKWRKVNIFTSGEAPKPCSGAGMLVSNSCVVVFGGDTGSSAETTLKIYRVKIFETNPVWEELKITSLNGNDSNVPESRTNFGYASYFTSDGAFFYIIGGCSASNTRKEYNSLIIINCSQSVYKVWNFPRLVTFKIIELNETNNSDGKDLRRVYCGCDIDKDGNLFIFGGRTQRGINSDLIVVMKDDLFFYQSEKEMYSPKAIERRREYRKKILNDEYLDLKCTNHEMEKDLKTQNSLINSNQYYTPFISIITNEEFAPSPRINPIIGKFMDQFFVFGGRDPVTGEILNDFFGYSMHNNEWSELPADFSPIIPPARELAALCFKKGKMLLFGGLGPNPRTGKIEPSNELWEYDIEGSIWKLLGKDSQKQPKPVIGASATIYMDYLIVSGGKLYDGRLNQDLSVFNFGTGTWKIYSEGVEAFKPALFVMNMTISSSSSENIMNESLFGKAKKLASINSKGHRYLPHYSESHIANTSHQINEENSEIRPVLVSIGGQYGTQPLNTYCLWDLSENFKIIKNSTQFEHSNRIFEKKSNTLLRNSEKIKERDFFEEDSLFHYVDGMTLQVRNKILMFGGKNGDHAMDSFKIVELDKFGKVKVTEDDGSSLGNNFHIDIVEAGCTIFERSVFCFGGRQVNEDRTIVPGAVDVFRIFNLTNVVPCALGSKESNDDCVECDAGEYCDDYDEIECKKCPPGTYDKYGDAKYIGCSPVPIGNYSDNPESNRITECDNDFTCPIGSAAMNKGYDYEYHISQPSSLEPNEFESIIKICVIVIPVCVGILVATLLLCFPTKAYLFKLDRFSDKYVDEIDPETHSSIKYIRKTTLGGFVSIIGISFVLGFALQVIVNFAFFNVNETQSYVDSSTDYTSKGISKFENKKVTIEVTLIDYAGSCVEGADFSTEISGVCSEKLGIGKTQYDPFNWYSSNSNSVYYNCSQKPSDKKYYPETHLCTITFQEQEISQQLTQNTMNYVSFHSTEKGASCRAIKVMASVDSAIPEQNKSKEKQNQLSKLQQVFINNYDSVLGGPVSTNVTIDLFHSIYYKSNVFRTFLPERGHLVNKISFEAGSKGDENSLFDIFGFGMNIYFRLDKTSLITHHSVKVSLMTLFTSLGGTFVYLGFVGNILPIFETFLNINWPCGRKVKKKLDSVFEDSLKKNQKKSDENENDIEMNEYKDKTPTNRTAI